MAAIPVTIVGTMTYSGLEVGGGPIFGGPGLPNYPSQGPGFPTHPIAPGGTTPPWGINVPPGIWPSPGYPAHPWVPPSGGPPPGIWGGAPLPWPTPPIYFPPEGGGGGGNGGAGEGGGGKSGAWAYSPIYGWVWVPTGGGDKPHPPQGPGTDPDAPQVNPLG